MPFTAEHEGMPHDQREMYYSEKLTYGVAIRPPKGNWDQRHPKQTGLKSTLSKSARLRIWESFQSSEKKSLLTCRG